MEQGIEAIDREFAALLLKTIDDPRSYGVHQLFNDWWRFAPESVKRKYLADFEAIPEQREFARERFYAEPLTLDLLAGMPAGSLGRAYHEFLVVNRLERNLAIHYRSFHEALEAAGVLDDMPEPARYAVLRGFQTHDFQHVVTGFDSSPRGEIALQAFCLAQIRFPYFAMWLSVVAARMTFLDPDAIQPAMDAITEGWTLGRRARCIHFEKWEQMLDQPLAEIRRRYRIGPTGRLSLAA